MESRSMKSGDSKESLMRKAAIDAVSSLSEAIHLLEMDSPHLYPGLFRVTMSDIRMARDRVQDILNEDAMDDLTNDM